MTDATRRIFLSAAALAVATSFAPIGALAQSSDPIRLVVPYGAGGLLDGLVREVGDRIAAELGQPVLVDNRPGSNGIIGATYAANADADGLTYFVGATGPLSLNVLLRDDLSYDMDSFEPVGTMMSGPLTITVPSALNVSTLEELKAHAESTGQPLRYATLGPGSVTHLFGMVLQSELGVPMVDVSYRDNPSQIVDLIAGQNDLNFATPISLVAHVNSGDVRMLAISSPERDPGFPDLPTTTELGFPGLVSSFWFGFLAPAGTPAEEVSRFSAALQNAMSDEELQQRMRNAGMQPNVGGPQEMQAQLDWDMDFWGGVIEANGITIE
ncbi:Bug family tripartite tricarboxylate transporter substrate binding protein [Mesorhizobium xinjiangense]|uniref:Bug family tripartite tricarboxylate transporter substrate binding protein n=1 Tax=Mesorhizobium xinjiangense TaxID=2678685 RepID=UPI0012EE9660|nr:tripartite tricarboxylate transporter substrate binding protein [Mesorhizobium xinjiangense]